MKVPIAPNAESGKQYLVLGAGIIGVCVALGLQRDGHAVTLMDRHDPGHGCSFGNAGIIHSGGCVPMATAGNVRGMPATLADPDGALRIPLPYLPRLLPWLFRMLLQSRPACVEYNAQALASLLASALPAYTALLHEAGLESLMRACGELYIYRTRQAFEGAAWEMNLRRRFGVPVQELDSDAIHQLEPGLSREYSHAYFQPASHFVTSPLHLIQGLSTQFVKNGGTLIRNEVLEVHPHAEGGASLHCASGIVRAPNLILCSGAWSKRFAAQLGYHIALESWRGYHIQVPRHDLQLGRVVADGEKHIAISPMLDGLRVAGYLELASLHAPANFEQRSRRLLALAQSMMPEFPPEITSQWMGHRPGMPDSLPVIGQAPDHAGVYFAFGHGQLGLTFGAITGTLIADIVAGRTSSIDISPFRVRRGAMRRATPTPLAPVSPLRSESQNPDQG